MVYIQSSKSAHLQLLKLSGAVSCSISRQLVVVVLLQILYANWLHLHHVREIDIKGTFQTLKGSDYHLRLLHADRGPFLLSL